ncbi:hypothetical protein PCASD_22435 [Puccinia coronata f. sp. avenae]|uniref:C2H2-type domain-containing protein n=1 Tax=Puccinia coronata f. sp. avenae TaxID=200324 RepID=A0A2N5SN85_9BASI|nr:hypothetical protein PCASD_22435 [Puccinia coronata f. sp. avenae]
MQPIPPSCNSSDYRRGYLNHSQGDRHFSNPSLCGDQGMLLSSSNGGIDERNLSHSVQHTFSLAPSPSSTYRSTSRYMSNSSEPNTSRFMGQVSIENQYDFMPNHHTHNMSSMALPFATSLQQDYNGNPPQSNSHRELSDLTHYEHSSCAVPSSRRSPKLYSCEICDKKFVRPSSLTTHRFSHTGEKPHTCPTCGKSFSVASNLRRHEITIHGPRASTSGNISYEGTNQTTSGGLQSASLVGSKSSSVIYQRGSDTYENLLPSHEMFRDIHRGSDRRM